MSHGLSAAELEDIRISYEEELAGLTFNSKPIINMLTTIAQENLNAAAVICKSIEGRVRSAPPHQKLPVMYLLDSVSKNVGSPFTPIFGQNLYKTYMDCYTAVDNNTRRSLESLFSTWKLPVAGSNSPVPVYPVEDTRRIDEALLRIRAVQDRNPGYPAYAQTPAQYHSPSPFPQQQQHYGAYPPVVQYPNPTPDYYRQSPPVQFGQYPPNPSGPAQVRHPAANTVIADIDGLLRTLDTRARLNPEDATTLKFITSLRGLHELLSTQNLRPLQIEDIRNSLREVAAFCAQPVRALSRLSPLPPSSQGINMPPLDLFAQLAKAGMLPQSGSNTPLSIPLFQQQQQQASMIYIELSSSAMLQSRPELIDMLYTSMPLQCYQCGRRWSDNPTNRVLKDEHLDWHFKTNKRLREHAVRTQSRALYLSETEWINFKLGTDDAQDQTNTSVINAVDPSTATVPKPSDPALHDSVCPICKEPFDTDWDDTNEQWIWKNAVDIAGVAYHSTCHAETLAAQKKSTSVQIGGVKIESKQETNLRDNDAVVPDVVAKDEEEDEDEDIVLPGMPVDPEIKAETIAEESTSIPQELVETENDAVIEDAPSVPFDLADTLKSLSGTLDSLTNITNGNKRKASEEPENRRVKVEPEQ